MFEGLSVQRNKVEATVINYDVAISEEIEKLRKLGLDMSAWEREYESISDEDLENFYNKLMDFSDKRQDALSAFEFDHEMSGEEIQQIKDFDRKVMAAYKDHENFLGNGATAEVYGMSDNNNICVKFIINQDRYNENNHIRTEFGLLSRVHDHTKEGAVRTPYPIFLRIHARDGHSYGMERINGASLSQLIEFSDKYPDVLEIARSLDRRKLEVDLVRFVSNMHEAGVVHNDMYMRNIMLDREGRLFVIDFGKAKSLDFKGDREDDRKLDLYRARQALIEFFNKLDLLTN